ncbi:MAG: T9SS type A sorting domain-containing protein [Bacteroidetes bacterium]|nr:T9SS type A sorting domain-containing protein [Bacteroidota bacterium]
MKNTPILLTIIIMLMIEAYAQTATPPSNFGDGDGGTSANPYEIASLDNLYWLSQNSAQWGKYYMQSADIDAASTSGWHAGAGFSPIGWATKFTGHYAGHGHTISNLTISRSSTDYVGFFGQTNGAVIDSLGLVNVSITGSSYVGGIVGWSESGTISYCYTTGAVTGVSVIGGMVGQNYSNGPAGLVTNSYSTATVTASGNTAGGIAGDNLGSFSSSYVTISYCYSAGAVSASSLVGGISGRNYARAIVTRCLWNTESTGQSSTVGSNLNGGSESLNSGLTTTQMKTQSPFTSAGWNFTSVWQINEGITYPSLKWQGAGALPVELSLFTAAVSNTTVVLRWTTATEVNNHGFEVERKNVSGFMSQASSDHASNLKLETSNPDWIRISFVEGAGNSNISHEYSYLDRSVPAGTYAYRLKQIDRDGKFSYSQEVEAVISAPTIFALEQNYPNPFNPLTVIGYQIPMNGFVTLKVYDALGREVTTLVNEVMEAGSYSSRFDGSSFSSGVYFYTLRAGSFSASKRFSLIK